MAHVNDAEPIEVDFTVLVPSLPDAATTGGANRDCVTSATHLGPALTPHATELVT